jgi:hypothetical protein
MNCRLMINADALLLPHGNKYDPWQKSRQTGSDAIVTAHLT